MFNPAKILQFRKDWGEFYDGILRNVKARALYVKEEQGPLKVQLHDNMLFMIP